MEITLTHKTSELFCEIYTFEVDYDNIEYVGYWASRRNSPNDPWGHEWNDFYSDKIGEVNKKFASLMDETEDECEADMVRMDWKAALEEFYPTCHKANDGKPFLGGEFGPAKWLPKLPWATNELEKLVMGEMIDKLRKTRKSIKIK